MGLADDLRLQNPWWETTSAWDGIERRFERQALLGVLNCIEDRASEPGVLLVGFRRVGKTVLVRQALRRLHLEHSIPSENFTYVDFQETLARDATPIDIVKLAFNRRDVQHPVVVALDEIQFVPDWDRSLRSVLQENDPRELIVIATGSGSSELRRGSGDVLLDRVRHLSLGPMTFAEWRSMLTAPGKPAEGPLALLEDDLRRFQVRGGFPGLITEPSDFDARRRLRELCERFVIDGDLAPRLGIRERVTFGRVWQHFATHPGETLDWSKLPGEFGTKRETLEGWVHALLQAEMIVEVLPSSRSGEPLRGRKRYSRIYPVDPALSHAYGVEANHGAGIEALVLRQLRAYVDRRRELDHATELTYWRDDRVGGANEIDFRIEGDGISILIEVKGKRTATREMLQRVAAVAHKLGSDRVLLVYRGSERTVNQVDVKGVPIDVHQWPTALFLLAMEHCGADGKELWDGSS